MPAFVRASIAAVGIASLAPSAHAADLPADTTAYLREAVAGHLYTGVIVGLIDGDSLTIQSFGSAQGEGGAAPDADTVFEIGSITKTFTATLLAQEVLAGRTKLDDPLQNYVPPGVTVPQVGDRPITIADLATHYSGLPRLPAGMDISGTDPYSAVDQAKLWALLSSTKPARAPGVAQEYSNFGFAILGAVIAREAGKPYRQLVRERIFEPLRMTHSDTAPTLAMGKHLAQGHDAVGRPVPHWVWSSDAMAGAGAIYSSLNDLLAYLRANMATAGGTGPAGALRDAIALAQEPRAAMGQGRIGLAWTSAPGKAFFAHDGGTYGFSSFIAFTGDGRRGVAILSNSFASGTIDRLGMHLIDSKNPLPVFKPEAALTPAMLAEYPGRYALAPAIEVTVTPRPRGIEMQLTGQAASPVFATAPDRFDYRVVPVTAQFDRDASGRVVRLVIHQQGGRFRAPRLGVDGKPLPQPARLALTPVELDAYVGRYRLGDDATISITRSGDTLMAQGPRQPAPAAIFAEQPDHFEFEQVDADLLFERDGSGKVIAVRLGTAPDSPRASRILDATAN